jgi:hypothetical protein
MSELHEKLWSLCRKLPSDFAPYGERDRGTAESCADCSCGCRHFLPLEGELGKDWGICANSKSPRAGLLTFEHQGCPEFETELEESIPQKEEVPHEATPPKPAKPPGQKIKINFDDLQMALEGFEAMGDPISHFLDTETGEILVLSGYSEDYEELSARLDEGLGDRYLRIEPMESHESFRIMEDFAESLTKSRLKTQLQDALTRNKPFRHFKDALHSDLAIRGEWFVFRDDAMAQYAKKLLEGMGVEAELQRRHRE